VEDKDPNTHTKNLNMKKHKHIQMHASSKFSEIFFKIAMAHKAKQKVPYISGLYVLFLETSNFENRLKDYFETIEQ
jgi:hypothetical protein